jgi:hypothetical protein
MARKALLLPFFLMSSMASAQEAPTPLSQQSYVSSAEMTYIWKYMGIRLIETYGQVGNGPAYTGKWQQQSYREKGGLRVVVHAAKFDDINGPRIAYLAALAFDTVSRIAGKPPVSEIELYLTPPNTSYAVRHRSWAIGPHHSVVYAITSQEGGYDVERLVGDVAPAAKYTLASRYGSDTPLDSLFVDGTIKRGTPGADALYALCKVRATKARRDLKSSAP